MRDGIIPRPQVACARVRAAFGLEGATKGGTSR